MATALGGMAAKNVPKSVWEGGPPLPFFMSHDFKLTIQSKINNSITNALMYAFSYIQTLL